MIILLKFCIFCIHVEAELSSSRYSDVKEAADKGAAAFKTKPSSFAEPIKSR